MFAFVLRVAGKLVPAVPDRYPDGTVIDERSNASSNRQVGAGCGTTCFGPPMASGGPTHGKTP